MQERRSYLKPGVLWITGLSESGKTKISKIIFLKLKKKYKNIVLLDGDKLRKKLNIRKINSFSYLSRKKVGLKYSKICKNLINKKNYVIISVMALIKFVHTFNKKNLINYNDVYLKVPIKELIRRDPKKIYEKFRKNKISNVQGLDLKYDEPNNPSLKIVWKKKLTPIRIANKILNFLEKKANYN